MVIIGNFIAGIVLALCTFQDIKSRSINVLIPACASAIMLLLKIIRAGNIEMDVLISMLPGLIMIATACILKGRVGYGDGIVLVCVCICTGMYRGIIALSISFILLWLVCLVALSSGRKIQKNTSVPYIPFVLGGWLATIISVDVTGWL